MRPSLPTREGLANVTAEWEDLYTRHTPDGDPIPLMFQMEAISDEPPSKKKIVMEVWSLYTGIAGGPLVMQEDHLKLCLQEAT